LSQDLEDPFHRLSAALDTFLDSFRAAIGLYFFELSFQ